jgi:hypothetical protein
VVSFYSGLTSGEGKYLFIQARNERVSDALDASSKTILNPLRRVLMYSDFILRRMRFTFALTWLSFHMYEKPMLSVRPYLAGRQLLFGRTLRESA